MAKINTLNYQTVAAWNGSQDLLIVEQPDGTKVATPAMVKQFIEAGDFEVTGEIADGHGNKLKDMAKSADVDDALADKQDTLTFDNVPTENSNNPVKGGGIFSTIANKIKKLPTQTTRYNFTAANTYQYTGVNVTCPAGHTYIVRVWLVYSNSEPKGIVASSRSDTMRMYECYAREELATSITFVLMGGESAYIWGKGTTTNGDDVKLDIVDITN